VSYTPPWLPLPRGFITTDTPLAVSAPPALAPPGSLCAGRPWSTLAGGPHLTVALRR